MPEWPEMEHYKRMLNRQIAGQTITSTVVQREKSLNVTTDVFHTLVIGRTVTHIERRAKMLLFQLDDGHTLLLHLMLGGWMFYGTEEEKPQRTIQITLQFGNIAHNLYFIGLRLGYLHIYNPNELEQRLADLGPDPFEPSFTISEYRNLLNNKHSPLKVILTDQSVIAGIGNCYSDEICFASRIRPSRRPESLSTSEWQSLYEGMHATLREAVDYGGYMDHSFMSDDRITGGFDSRCKVYDREGEPCYRCGNLIRREDIGAKKSFYCPQCQS